MLVRSVLDLYDLLIANSLAEKFTSVVGCNWLYAPSDLAFQFAKDEYGEKFFPLYNVFREEPAVLRDGISSLAGYRDEYVICQDERKLINFLHVDLKYQIDFYSNIMQDMNQSNIDYFKFQSDRTLEIDFSEAGLTFGEDIPQMEINFDEPVSNSDMSAIFDVGRYFRYTYSITLSGLIFDVIDGTPFELNNVIINLYQKEVLDANLLATIDVDIPEVE